MFKRAIIIAILIVMAFRAVAFASDTSGEVVFRDALYGTAIGAILGGAVYLIDDDELGKKMGIGIAVGTIGGLVFGITESRSAVEIKRGKIDLNLPTFAIYKKEKDSALIANLLKVRF